jgi:hypothetical protein
MSMTKRYFEDLSVKMGYEGVLSPEFLANMADSEYLYNVDEDEELIRMHERQRQLANQEMEPPADVKECKGCEQQFQTEDLSAEYCSTCTSHLNEGESY